MNNKFKITYTILILLSYAGFSQPVVPNSPVPLGVVSTAGARPRSITYAETLNGADQKRYEFMITSDGKVIYKAQGDIWKYFGEKGYSLNTTDFDNDFKSIGPVDMIAACGNRVFVKKRGANQFYFAEMVDGNIKPNIGDGSELNYATAIHGYPFFITSAPDDYSIDENYDDYAQTHILANSSRNIDPWLAFLLPLSKNKATTIINNITQGILASPAAQAINNYPGIFGLFSMINRTTTRPAIPYSWPVVIEKQKWYRLKADNLGSLKVLDIGASEVNKVEAARYAYRHQNSIEKYVKKFGGEYWREYAQPLINLKTLFWDNASNRYVTGYDNRDYGSLIDGIANYYILTSDNGNYQVWGIDEQAFFCSQWYKFAENLEFSLNLQHEPLVTYNIENWTKSNYVYRNSFVILRILFSFIQVNMFNNTIYDTAWNFASDQIRYEGDYLPQFAEVGPYIDDPWLWTAQENVHQPELLISGNGHSNLVPYFLKGQWKKVNIDFFGFTYYYILKNQFDNASSPMWAKYPPLTDIPSLAITKVGNIALCTKDKIYTLNYVWGSLDFSWRVRNKPAGAIGNNIMLQYMDNESNDTPSDKLGRIYIVVPGTKNGVWGYYRQNYLKKDFLTTDTIRPTYDYIDRNGSLVPSIASPEDAWEWFPRTSPMVNFTNSIYDFLPIIIIPHWPVIDPRLIPDLFSSP